MGGFLLQFFLFVLKNMAGVGGGYVGVPINKIIRLMEVVAWLPRHPCTCQWWWSMLQWLDKLRFWSKQRWRLQSHGTSQYLKKKPSMFNAHSEYLVHVYLYLYIYYHWKPSDIWARLIFSLLIIRLDIASLRYAYYVHLLCPSYHFLCAHFHFFGSADELCVKTKWMRACFT